MMVSLNAGASGSRRVDGWELTVRAGGRGDQHDWGSAGVRIILYTCDTVLSLASKALLVNSEREV